ncbi:site-specific DNA-methyltransferase (adenine-specific)/modification methylase [Cetobacterium ceti]|uniref:Site-specific DNA-methyltransferase (Adenine-specific)/modification methylase n=1 Tax=Cetobacterium ceti TaxID=180163 RepID=A0A1T4QCA6_9FUSO|nr:DNA methyltransferase [Cetobacterium ceti]SKA01267.1 site-specific DNA-methyltransferase (adenine-specific)/modification methylase [Cetobacterium ceti]
MEIKTYNGEALETIENLIDKGIKVDLILCDPPYGVTKNKWDKKIDPEKMWKVLKKNRKETTPIILFCVQPYTSELVITNSKEFKYMKYWKKDRPKNFLNANKQPLREIEEVAIFYKKQCFYNPQKIHGEPNHSTGKAKGKIKKLITTTVVLPKPRI